MTHPSSLFVVFGAGGHRAAVVDTRPEAEAHVQGVGADLRAGMEIVEYVPVATPTTVSRAEVELVVARIETIAGGMSGDRQIESYWSGMRAVRVMLKRLLETGRAL